nr:hypothetical protein [Acinetobacter baumannii]
MQAVQVLIIRQFTLCSGGREKTHLFYPQGTQAGLDIQDKGQQTVLDAQGGRYEAMRTYFQWDVGLSVRDWRSVVRIANIDVSDLSKDASTGANLIDLLDEALSLLPLAGFSTYINLHEPYC